MKKRIEKIKYWFEENILGNIYSTIIFLIICTLIFVSIMSLIMYLIEKSFTTDPEDFIVYFYDNLYTVINAWYPEIPEEGGLVTWGNYLFKIIVALFGIFVTSIIIAFFCEKVARIFEDTRKKNRKIVENNHIVILGYTFGD